MPKKIVATPDAPKAIGPYSQAVLAGPYVFLSGQIALDPASGLIVDGGIEAQTVRVMENLKAVLKAAGTSLDKVVKCTLYLQDMSDFVKVNEIYGRYFDNAPPARATVEVARLPKDAALEIDAIAYLE